MQLEFHTKSVFDELELVMEITTSSRTSHVSMDFMLQEHGVPCDRPKDSNAGG
jgi:hypothetical protein